ncbi:hydroxyethylthiazole kinase-like uncharacterized protein yjeF/hydroxyethylthiazole kinase-like uncharacterized protein yjeF [Paucimonas lemoignei]|uniref:Bifunctional NAD(P)H-hydrate repair enzyme n=1 Tax=Paucimonas lemoignei TaxID=29443 RepID=A0A4V2UJ97_PAULE|nr:NAD(P)H-hydrate dehydratase [Paucimonas lemoignei]TCS39240.1 hydroxyethylthiazole kinase-like uncharacterized protein yjeF/hydroxyethylthiazole kinase-like uncharacterized protein yjeF [Paucimonas lemoignei]
MNALYTVEEIRRIEQAALSTLPTGTLMQRAGADATALALDLLGTAMRARVLVLAGPGNNGGDALEVAAELAEAGSDVTVILFAAPKSPSPEAGAALARARSSLMKLLTPQDAGSIISLHTQSWQLVIDGLFGIGLMRPITGDMRVVAEYVNTLNCPVLALDVPSGLDADTGDIVGPDGIAVQASHTITFIGDKPGLHTCHGRDYAGQVSVASLDIDDAFFPSAQASLNDPTIFSDALQPRRQNTHKGSFGDVAVLGGAHGMHGAALLSARAALHCGAGRVYACFIDEVSAFDPLQPEIMCRPALEFDFTNATVVAGPGAGNTPKARHLLETALGTVMPLVLDADALNILAGDNILQQRLSNRNSPAIMTPHPLEAARLLGVSAGMVQADRLAAARQLAARFNAIVVLKGSGSVIARPDGMVAVNPTGNPALATAGTGDVLAGLCGALLSQGLPVWEAALAAVWLHGHAADELVDAGIGPVGLTAGELIPAIRTALNRTIKNARQDAAPITARAVQQQS